MFSNPRAKRYRDEHGVRAYMQRYNAGWRRSMRVGSIPDSPIADDDAWMDGYLDYAVGREKWHLRDCADHDNCP